MWGSQSNKSCIICQNVWRFPVFQRIRHQILSSQPGVPLYLLFVTINARQRWIQKLARGDTIKWLIGGSPLRCPKNQGWNQTFCTRPKRQQSRPNIHSVSLSISSRSTTYSPVSVSLSLSSFFAIGPPRHLYQNISIVRPTLSIPAQPQSHSPAIHRRHSSSHTLYFPTRHQTWLHPFFCPIILISPSRRCGRGRRRSCFASPVSWSCRWSSKT